MTPHSIQSIYTPLDLVLLVFVVVVMPILSARAGRVLARARPPSLVPRYWGIIARGLLVSVLVLVDWIWAGRPLPALGLDWPIGFRGQIGFAIGAGLACYYACTLLLRKFEGERLATMRKRLESLRIMPATRGEFALFPFVAIVGSSMEELLFRGFLIWLFAPFAGLWGAAAISSLLFGLGHAYQGVFGVVRTALIGLAFAVGYVLTGSLWWLMLVHMMLNLSGWLFALRLKRMAA
jgi:membrane protease YdiL (CAAX protease family)